MEESQNGPKTKISSRTKLVDACKVKLQSSAATIYFFVKVVVGRLEKSGPVSAWWNMIPWSAGLGTAIVTLSFLLAVR